MLGIVTASKLNVRSKPDKNSRSRGVLTKGTAIPITGQTDDWIEFRFQDFPAYVYKNYVAIQPNNRDISATVTANLLNVRSQPDLRGSIIGKLPKSTRVDVVALLPQWLEIQFNDGMGYISRDHIQLHQEPEIQQGRVIASVLNVRSQPQTHSEKLGQIARGTLVNIQSQTGHWLQIHFNGIKGFVHSHYVELLSQIEEPEPSGPAEQEENEHAPAPIATPPRSALAPDRLLPLNGDSTSRKVALAWNKYGKLLGELCEDIEIDNGVATAVLCVESSGKGFQPSNQNRMIIRFENHKFWKYWGKQNQTQFKRHFVYQAGQAWKGHKWRRDEDDPWKTFHGNQQKEWQVFNFARTLNEEAALYSISMGLPQIMGFNYARLGYANVSDMFVDFEQDIEAHIRGFFNFFDQPMVQALRSLDFVTFAGRYNGSGQKQKYGSWIKQHYDAFKLLTLTHSL